MTVTIDLPPEIQEWLNRKLEAGAFASPADFIKSRLHQDWLEEKLDEALNEPAATVTSEDWADARRRLEDTILRNR